MIISHTIGPRTKKSVAAIARRGIVFGLLLSFGCLEPYDPDLSSENVDFLVVDGFLNVSDRSCLISLSRTIPLGQQQEILREGGSSVSLEYDNGAVYQLDEIGLGQYYAQDLPDDEQLEVRLRIISREREYNSDYVKPLVTPPIDSVTFGADRIGVPIFVSTHDVTNNTSYYIWNFQETWTYTSPYESALEWNGSRVIEGEIKNHRCWSNDASTEIIIASSNADLKDVNAIKEFIVATLPWESGKIQDRYSIMLRQRAIPREAFDYLSELKKNTENLGTLFDPLPSEPVGNMSSVSPPFELVLGYFTAASVTSHRIFIDAIDLDRPEGTRSVTGYESCGLFEIERLEQYDQYAPVGTTLPHRPRVGTYAYCIDCELIGGSAVKPIFWK